MKNLLNLVACIFSAFTSGICLASGLYVLGVINAFLGVLNSLFIVVALNELSLYRGRNLSAGLFKEKQ